MPLSACKLATPIEAVATAGTFTCFSPIRPAFGLRVTAARTRPVHLLGIADGVQALPLQITLVGTLRSSRGTRRRVIMTARARHPPSATPESERCKPRIFIESGASIRTHTTPLSAALK